MRTNVLAPVSECLGGVPSGHIQQCIQMITLNISTEAALALQALLHTADFKDAANYCSDYDEDLLHVRCGEVVVELGDALAAANA